VFLITLKVIDKKESLRSPHSQEETKEALGTKWNVVPQMESWQEKGHGKDILKMGLDFGS
jgi:hypothetical protein